MFVTEMYVKDVKSGTTVSDKEPVILKELAGTAWVDGNNLLGPCVGKFCIDLAIKKAKEAGIGMVVAKGMWKMGNTRSYAGGGGFISVVYGNLPSKCPKKGP